MENCVSIPLDVVTLSPTPPPPNTKDSGTLSPMEPAEEESITTEPSPKRAKLASTGSGGSGGDSFTEVVDSAPAWILDVDLDFFSTGNPFRSAYTEVCVDDSKS